MIRIAVCICTYRRAAQLDRLLQALTHQRWTRLPAPAITVFVVENEAEGPGRLVCRRYAAARALDIRYFAEPRPGVPVARNRCLEMAVESSDFIALIDDDEFPMPDWLDQLLSLQRSTRGDVVTGSVVGANPISTPAWLARSRAHDSHPPVIADGAAINRLLRSLFRPFPSPKHVASGTVVNWCDSGNVLFRTDIIRATGMRFDESLSHFGFGADTMFFRKIALAGYRIVWSNEAVVTHQIAAVRMSATWFIRTALQRGICGLLVEQRIGGRAPSTLGVSLYGFAGALLHIAMLPVSLLAGWRHVVWHLSQAAYFLGRCAGVLGIHLHYNRRAEVSDSIDPTTSAGAQGSTSAICAAEDA